MHLALRIYPARSCTRGDCNQALCYRFAFRRRGARWIIISNSISPSEQMLALAIVKETLAFAHDRLVPRATISHRSLIVAIMVLTRGQIEKFSGVTTQPFEVITSNLSCFSLRVSESRYSLKNVFLELKGSCEAICHWILSLFCILKQLIQTILSIMDVIR